MRGARKKLDSLQLARAIAVLSVLLAHAVGHPFAGAPGVFHLMSRYGVTLFFIISGYIMVLTTGPGRVDPGKFMYRRVSRIVPTYYIANVTLAIATLVAPGAFKSTIFDLKHIILSLLFIPMYRPDGSGFILPFFRLGWTLNYEMFFYLMFAACFALTARNRVILLTGLFAALIAIGAAIPFHSAIPVFFTQVDLAAFVAGMWLGLAALRGPLRLSRGVRAALLLGGVAALAAIVAMYGEIRSLPLTQYAIIAICAAHIIALTAVGDGPGKPIPAFLLLIGDASYSIYLFHMFAVGAVFAAAHHLPAIALPPLMALAIIAGLAVGVAAYRFIETPIVGRLKRWGERDQARPPVEAAVLREPAA